MEMLKAIQSQYVRRAGLIASSATHLLFFAQCKLHLMLAPVRDQLNADLTALRANKTPLKSFFSSTKGYVRSLFAVLSLFEPTKRPLPQRVRETPPLPTLSARRSVSNGGLIGCSTPPLPTCQPCSAYALTTGVLPR